MTRIAIAMRPWTVCFSCGSALQPDQRWLDNDGLLCRECARRRRIGSVLRSELARRAARKGTPGRFFTEAAEAR